MPSSAAEKGTDVSKFRYRKVQLSPTRPELYLNKPAHLVEAELWAKFVRVTRPRPKNSYMAEPTGSDTYRLAQELAQV